ncbi:unnamed protein product [Albugo candida]|uniref:Uncharacterized protein n=1 Tax=Albugo candida TaxID=65357 RepID=A0A024GT91_9STRA|nr:unnamed protein product [Albugo candida]|eukprot:CCI49995.1 unnamed protein product [Albugo candida]
MSNEEAEAVEAKWWQNERPIYSRVFTKTGNNTDWTRSSRPSWRSIRRRLRLATIHTIKYEFEQGLVQRNKKISSTPEHWEGICQRRAIHLISRRLSKTDISDHGQLPSAHQCTRTRQSVLKAYLWMTLLKERQLAMSLFRKTGITLWRKKRPNTCWKVDIRDHVFITFTSHLTCILHVAQSPLLAYNGPNLYLCRKSSFLICKWI